LMDQFVYIVTNPSIPNQIKVGRTTDPDRRLKELQTSGVPTPYRYEFVILVENSKESEATAHYALRFNRVARNREFFRIDVNTAIKKIADEIRYFKIYWRYTPENAFTKTISGDLGRFASAEIRKIENELERKNIEVKALKRNREDIEDSMREIQSKNGSRIGLAEKWRLRIFGDKNKVLESEKINQSLMVKLLNERKVVGSRIESCESDQKNLVAKLKWRKDFFKEELQRLKDNDRKAIECYSEIRLEAVVNDYSMERFDWYRDAEGVKCDILGECYPDGEFVDHGKEISIEYRKGTYFISTEKIADFQYYKKQRSLF
jgi:hypothetical protein